MMLCPGCEGVKKAAYATFIIMFALFRLKVITMIKCD